MTLTSPPSLLRALLGAIAFASFATACATADTSATDGTGIADSDVTADASASKDTGSDLAQDTAGRAADTGGVRGDTGTGTCVSKCLRNYDCETSCAKPSGTSLNCCDTATGTCYLSSSTCPVPTDPTDSGTPPAY